MTVPEAAMHETDSSEATKDQVRGAGKAPIMKPIPETTGVQRTSKYQFWFRILGADSRHHSRSDCSINYIDHQLTSTAMKEREIACISRNVTAATKKFFAVLRSKVPSKFDYPKTVHLSPDHYLNVQTLHHTPIRKVIGHGHHFLVDPIGKRPAVCH